MKPFLLLLLLTLSTKAQVDLTGFTSEWICTVPGDVNSQTVADTNAPGVDTTLYLGGKF